MHFGQTPGSKAVQKNAYGPGVAGRPKGRVTRPKPMYLMGENSHKMPEYMTAAKELMDTYGNSSLPSGLQPRWLLNKKNKNISKGMTKGN